MARRNLRKWAEAKDRRAQQVPPLGRWSYAGGVPIFWEDPPFGTAVAPTVWLPMDPEPLFPESVGEVLHAILHPEPKSGAPYTHTLNWPPTEYDEDGEPLPPRIEPSITVTRVVRNEVVVSNGPGLHPLLLDHGIDRGLTRTG